MTVLITRSEHTAAELGREAGRTADARASRRMLALALVLEGENRETAARQCGMDRQTLRDWEVGDLIPDLFDQMIMFVISSEREGFADAFYGRQGVRYLTLWGAGDERTEVRDGLPSFQAFHQVEAAA